VFAIVGRHLISESELVKTLAHDKDFGEAQAKALVQEVQERDYSPPRREKIREDTRVSGQAGLPYRPQP